MADIGRSLDEVEGKVKQLTTSLTEAKAQTKLMDKALQLDPKATEVATQRIKTLKDMVGQATQKVALMKQKQAEANKSFEAGDIGATTFNKIKSATAKAELELQKFNAQLKNAERTKINSIAGQFDKVTSALNKTQSVARSFSRLALGLVTIIGGAITAFAKTTLELNTMAKAYDVNIEKMQLQRNLYKEITGDADNYNKTLDVLKKTLNAITLGQGNGYANILNYLGISTTDLNGKTKSTAEIYEELLIAFGGMEDITLRNQLAYELFGEEAINILEILSMTKEEIDALNQAQIEQGIITEENAATAQAIQEQWDGVKQQFMQVAAELAEKLLPLIKALADFMTEFILPIITAIANWFAKMSPQEQQFLFFLLMLIIFLPKIIGFVTAIIGIIKAITIASYGAAGGVGAVSAAATPLIPIMLAVVAVVLVLALLFAFLTGRSKDLSKSLDGQQKQMDGIASSYEDMGTDFSVNSEQTSQNTNTNKTEIEVTIDSRGDNPIAEENAELVADLLAERINKELGGKI